MRCSGAIPCHENLTTSTFGCRQVDLSDLIEDWRMFAPLSLECCLPERQERLEVRYSHLDTDSRGFSDVGAYVVAKALMDCGIVAQVKSIGVSGSLTEAVPVPR